jgi:signal transduction histidine kinase
MVNSVTTQPPAPTPVVADQALPDSIENLEQWAGDFAEQIRQTQKLAAMGTMAAVLAHEFNNLLTRAINYAESALMQPDDVHSVKRSLTRILDSCSHAAQISRSIFDFSGTGDESRRPVALVELVSEAVNCLGRDPAKDNIAVRSRIAPDVTVVANRVLLQQVIFNLLVNARQAILADGRQGGRLTVSADRTADGRVELRVADTGCGIAPEDLQRIFKPFFSTKSAEGPGERRGVGLGLAICRSIVEEHGGEIIVESELGVGTTFTITLPGN